MATAYIGFASGERGREARRELLKRPSFLYSTNVLIPVCESLDLAAKWGRRFSPSDHQLVLTEESAYALLCDRLGLIRSKDAALLVAVFAVAETPHEAVELVNEVVRSCRTWFNRTSPSGKRTVWISQPSEAIQRTIIWVILVKGLIVVIPCAVIGVILLWRSRGSPPAIPLSVPTSATRYSKY